VEMTALLALSAAFVLGVLTAALCKAGRG